MKYIALCSRLLIFLISLNSFSQEKKTISNETFLQQAELNGLSSADLGLFAQKKIADKRLKKYVLIAHNDQVQANNKLLLLAVKKNIQLLNLTTDTSSGKELDVDNTLHFSEEPVPAQLKNVFDVSFVKMMIEDYQNAIGFYESSLNTQDTDVKAYIEECLPLFKKNLFEATRFTGQALAKE